MNVRRLIHTVDPYDGIVVPSDYTLDLQGWGSNSRVFHEVLCSVDARDILEVGSWKGASAIFMARLQQSFGRKEFEITCVDTWLGSLEFWLDQHDTQRYKALALVYGHPTVYYTFLCNVVGAHLQSHITPFPVTSAIAARFFVLREVLFDVIYIDASHDYADVTDDLHSYWPLLRAGGVMFGDDYGAPWTGVMQAVDEFAADHKREAVISDQKWIIRR